VKSGVRFVRKGLIRMNNFLPKDYEVPAGKSNYMRFEIGENKFRILSSPILGYEGWNTDKDGSRKPIRHRVDEEFPIDEVDDPEQVKHFWAMPVWNYGAKMVQILEITQKGIQRTLRALAKDPEWGSPLGYDISIVRTGEGLNTEYETIPSPPKLVDKKIKEAYELRKINLEALYDGEDPFVEEFDVTP
jgi:hypothetical protein